jgi:hypothetical protein
VNIQNAPALPAPGEGMQGLADLLGKAGVFKDITGLDANQQNVIRTYLSNQENAKAFAEMAKEMAMQQHNTQNAGKIMDSITAAKNSNAITQQEAGQLVKDQLQQQIDGGAAKKAQAEAARQDAATLLSRAAVQGAGQDKNVTASRVDSSGNMEAVTIGGASPGTVLAQVFGQVPKIKQDPKKKNDCWAVAAAMMIGWKYDEQDITAADAARRAGQRFLQLYNDNNSDGLMAGDVDDFALHSEMAAEPPVSYRLQQYIDWMNTYGPLWVAVDSNPARGVFSPHARVLTKISGTGSPDGIGTQITFIDPSTGTEATQEFSEFLQGFEQMARDNRGPVLPPQVLHFIDKVSKGIGFQIEGPFGHEPIHENITLAALLKSRVSVRPGATVGSDLPLNEFFRGVLWNDDPAILMFHEDLWNNWRFTTRAAWLMKFELAKYSAGNNVANLTGRSHFYDLQFLHAMASEPREAPGDTLAKIMLWAELMYRLSIGEGVSATDKLDKPIASAVDVGGVTYSYSLSQFFDDLSRPTGQDTFGFLLTQDTACLALDLGRRAIGSLLHMVQDSYARGHVRRTLLNPGDRVTTDLFKPGTYGQYGEVENFHCYRGQDETLHDKYDKPQGPVPEPANLDSFNALLGGRDAIDASIKLLNMWQDKTPWAANGGPKELLEGTIFKLSANVSDADASVEEPDRN